MPGPLFNRCLLAGAILLSGPLVAATGVGNYLKQTDPTLAIEFNPFNSDARVNRILHEFASPAAKDNLEPLYEDALTLITYAPTDARGYSLLAEVYHQADRQETAESLFETALNYSKTEIHALLRSFAYLAESGDYSTALDRMDLISRRWPQHFGSLAPYIAAILTKTEGYKKALELLQQDPPWRSRFFAALRRDDGSEDIAYQLHLDLHRLEGKSDPAETGPTMQSLIRGGRYLMAHRLFLFTLSDDDKKRNGYVFNSDFSAEPTPRPFDWRMSNSASAQVYWIGQSVTGDSEMRIRFLGKPVKTIGLSQLVRLPPGSFSITVEYSTSGLKIPKGLYLDLECVGQRQNAARLEFPERNLIHQQIRRDFKVGPDGCDLFKISLDTDLIAESFRYRYQGTLSFHEIRIDRLVS